MDRGRDRGRASCLSAVGEDVMTNPLPHRPTKSCPTCKGTGRVTHYPRTIVVDGRAVADPWDTRGEELCGVCFGSGVVPADTRTAADIRVEEDSDKVVKDGMG